MLILFLQKTFQQIIKKENQNCSQINALDLSNTIQKEEKRKKDNFAFIFKLIDSAHSHTMKI